MSYTDVFPPLPDKTYDIIYADPPWQYESLGHFRKKGMPYPTLDIEQLKLLPVEDIAAKDSILFLWTTGPQLDISIDLIPHWGYKFITVGFVWDKVLINPGFYTLSSAEFCLIARRGKIPTPRGSRNVKQMFTQKRTKHSKKPNEIREKINDMFPKQSKIELFARRPSTNRWDAWGNQADDNIIVEEKNKEDDSKQMSLL